MYYLFKYKLNELFFIKNYIIIIIIIKFYIVKYTFSVSLRLFYIV
jgi:hypothetical protein